MCSLVNHHYTPGQGMLVFLLQLEADTDFYSGLTSHVTFYTG